MTRIPMKLIHALPVTRGLDPRVHLPLPTLPRKQRRVGRGLDHRVEPGNDVGRMSTACAIAMKTSRATWRCAIVAICLPVALAGEARAYKAYVSNERSNTVSIIDTGERKVVGTIKVGQRPRGIAITKDQKYVLVAVGDDDTIQMIDTASNKVVDTLPSGPDPELFTDDPSGRLLYVANENDNTVTIIDIERRARLGDVAMRRRGDLRQHCVRRRRLGL